MDIETAWLACRAPVLLSYPEPSRALLLSHHTHTRLAFPLPGASCGSPVPTHCLSPWPLRVLCHSFSHPQLSSALLLFSSLVKHILACAGPQPPSPPRAGLGFYPLYRSRTNHTRRGIAIASLLILLSTFESESLTLGQVEHAVQGTEVEAKKLSEHDHAAHTHSAHVTWLVSSALAYVAHGSPACRQGMWPLSRVL